MFNLKKIWVNLLKKRKTAKVDAYKYLQVAEVFGDQGFLGPGVLRYFLGLAYL